MSSTISSVAATASSTTATTISRAASALATSLPASPAILNNPASLDFNQSIFNVIYVLVALTALTEAVGIAALATQLARKEQRRLVQKTIRSEGVYFLPHSPILAPIMVICYATVGLATLFVLKAFLWQGSAVAVIQRLSLLLPMPLLLFAWLSACANAFAWHLTPLGNSKFQHKLRLRPMTLNLITWITPIIIFAINLALVIVWPMVQSDAKALKSALTKLEAVMPDDSPEVDVLTSRYARKLRQAEGIYQAVWAMWALAYGLCWAIYTTYSSLLIALLDRQMKFVSTAVVTDPGNSRSTPSTPGEIASQVTPGTASQNAQNAATSKRPSTGDRRSIGGSVKRRSTNTLRFITSVGPEMRYISKRELLRRNTRLVIMELVAFSIFTIAWWILSITKAAMGYRILTNPITGPITVIGELFESTIFGLVVVSMLLVRGVNILRNRKEQISHGVTSTESSGSQTESRMVEMDREGLREKPGSPEDPADRPAKRPNLATRRGKNLLAIDLGSGTYFVPLATSTATTPTEKPSSSRRGSAQAGIDGQLGGPSMQHLLAYTDGSPSSGTSSAQAGTSGRVTPLSPFGPSSPMSERLAELSQTARRKSSVTFADAITPIASSPHRSPAVHTPTLESISASPLLPHVSLHDALSSNWSESARHLEEARNASKQADE